MPMSLRKNPPKKEMFEQDTPPSSKKIKVSQTPQSSPQNETAYSALNFPKLPKPAARRSSVRYIHSPLAISSTKATLGSSSQRETGKLDNHNGCIAGSEQVIWVGHVIQKIAAASDLSPFVRENETKLKRSRGQTLLIESIKALKRWPEDRIPHLELDTGLGYYLFPDQDENHAPGVDLRAFYGRMIITCLQKKAHPIVPNCAKTLTGYFESGQWNTPLYSALETIARSSAVLQALKSAVSDKMSSSSDQAQDVPNSSQVPSLITEDNRTDPSTPTETVRSMSAEASSSAKFSSHNNGHTPYEPSSQRIVSPSSTLVGSNVAEPVWTEFQEIRASPVHASNPSIYMQKIQPGSVRSQSAYSYDTTVNTSIPSSSAVDGMASDQINLHSKRPAVDGAVLQLVENIKAELDGNKDYTTSPKISHQSTKAIHSVASLERCLTHATPRVNIIMDAAQARATKDLYRLIEDHAFRPSSQTLASSQYPSAPAMIPHIPIIPPPGYQVVYHSQCAEYEYGGMSDPLADSGCAARKDVGGASHTTLPSNKLRLPRLAPKAGRRSR